MSGEAAGRRWERPFHWWGPPWAPPHPITLSELVGQGVIKVDQAGFLTAHLGAGGSIVVAALRSGTGKSTLAHALLEAIDPDRSLVYIRGTYEPFDWLAFSEPDQTTLLVNEISDHLPVYCWGACAKRVLQLAGDGYQVIATLHADSPESFLTLLQAPEIGSTEAQIVALDIVVFLDITASGTRYVSNIMTMSMDPESGRTIFHPVDL